jgi:NodT family efflux transporter outer membrane factor (OMF) lipoprotein
MRLFPLNFSLVALSLVVCAGCKVGPDYAAPGTNVPDAWHQGIRRDLSERDSRIETWWEGFGDRTLNSLIAKAREANPVLEIAGSRVRESRLQRRVAQSQLFPTIDATGAYNRVRVSSSLLTPVPATNPSNFFTTGFDAGWEIDIFGGVRRQVEATDALIGAAEESYRDTLISLYAEVALNYVEVRTLQDRLHYVRSNIAKQKEAARITEERFKAELVPEIDVTQAKSNLYTSEAIIPQLETQLSFARNRLSSLLGGFPGSLDKELNRSGTIPLPARDFGYGLPADLVRSRPDIRRAERELAAQSAIIGVAVSNLYPKFGLAGSFTFDAMDANNLFEGSSGALGFGPAFRWNVFSAGRVKNQIRVEEERAVQAYTAYENTVLLAVEEVEDSMVALVQERRRRLKLAAAAAETTKTVEKIEELYTSGLVDFQNVLDAQRSLLAAQDSAAASKGLVARNYISLYKALGGGAPPPAAGEVMEVAGEAPGADGEPTAAEPIRAGFRKLFGKGGQAPEEAPEEAPE